MNVINENTVKQLHPLEIRALRCFKDKDNLSFFELLKSSDMQEAQLRMAIEWLLGKAIINVVHEETVIFASLTDAGRNLKNGLLPEIRVIELLTENKSMGIDQIAAEIGEDIKETNIAVSNLKKTGIVEIQKGGIVTLCKNADLSDYEIYQKLIRRLADKDTISKEDFNPDEWDIITSNSRKRGKDKGLFRITEKTERQFSLTNSGNTILKYILKQGVTGKEISQLTPQMLKDGSWKNASFRAYNIEGSFPRIIHGRKNPYRQFLDFVKTKMISLGFEEMRGNLVESEFWNMDALFMPQFHAAREIHDAYFVKDPAYCDEIPEPNFSNVADAHTSGKRYGSKGWKYAFDKERTKRLVLRSQGTALSARQLANAPKVPGKYFSIARCFRYDTIDGTHAPDFFQIEGIVLGGDINFRHLLGLLKLFALEVAKSKELMFKPDYFPFTEPSVEVSIRHPSIGWMELGGAGIFRPEVTKPQGIDVPVIAWGLGLDRMAMVALGIGDIRDMFSTDLDLIRSRHVGVQL